MSRKSTETEQAYPELEKQRAKLGEVFSQLKEVDDRLEAALAEKREHEARAESILFQAELILDGKEVLPERDLSGEIRTLQEKREILRKAVELQQGRVDELTREATSAEYKRLKPKFVSEVKRLLGAVDEYQSALGAMRNIREGMRAAGLKEVFPSLAWPGMKPGDFERQREAFQFKLENAGLSEALR